MNFYDFGKINIMPNGDVYANVKLIVFISGFALLFPIMKLLSAVLIFAM